MISYMSCLPSRIHVLMLPNAPNRSLVSSLPASWPASRPGVVAAGDAREQSSRLQCPDLAQTRNYKQEDLINPASAAKSTIPRKAASTSLLRMYADRRAGRAATLIFIPAFSSMLNVVSPGTALDNK